MSQDYRKLPYATHEQFMEAYDEAEAFMDAGAHDLYNIVKSTAKLAIAEYILFKKGLQADRGKSIV
jgi:hypothetical protein